MLKLLRSPPPTLTKTIKGYYLIENYFKRYLIPSCSFMTLRMRALSARWNVFCTRYLYSSTKSINEKHDRSSSITYEKVKNITWYVHITLDRDLKHIILYEPADKIDPPLDHIHLTLQHRNVRNT